MDGIQETIYEALSYLKLRVQDGRYGKDDNFDSAAFEEDLQDQVINELE